MQITLNGILGVRDKITHNFCHPKQNNKNTSSNNNGDDEDQINEIEDEKIIFGFSLIFDSTFNGDSDLTQYITDEENPYVEIKLWQKQERERSKYYWVII